MARTNPIALIKNVALETAKAPAAVAGTAVGLARTAAGKGASALGSLVAHTKDSPAPAPTEAEPEPTRAPEVEIDPDQPVNVTQELGLDPSPVAKPKQARKATPKPVTRIDADAHPDEVDVTPADVAEAVAHRKGAGGPGGD